MRYFLQLQYNGANYAGWQIQNNAVAVQQKLQEALQVLLHQPTNLVGCGRTDTGVHALHFVAHFDTELILNAQSFLFSLNGLLPYDIVVYHLQQVADTAHARFDASSRTYTYYIATQKNAFINKSAWLFNAALDLNAMNAVVPLFLKYNDYSCFSKAHTQTKTNNCVIKYAHWQQQADIICFTITADRFLRGMVRAIVGTMIQVGLHKMDGNSFEQIIKQGKRSMAGKSVPAHGLYLVQVTYPYISFLKPPALSLPTLL
ncbi:MAG: tRNA pseudouridine(38-40) synthase TruA [Bacteroidia bacterium]|nr:tRNA pseudouridine(38-40) synthase TruA [Bacteroidia bacterium]HQU99697.1 tRNA pseudouridine(38-40) synthase TruA [Bacteroidia bacterium]